MIHWEKEYLHITTNMTSIL